jgi:hypothetical protein
MTRSPCVNGLFPLVQYSIDPDSRVRAGCISGPAARILPKYEEASYWVEQQLRFALKICIACLHVGQMLFAGNKYLLLKRITV